LEPDIEQATPHEPFRLTRAGHDFVMEAKTGDIWRKLYRFNLQEQLLPITRSPTGTCRTTPTRILSTGLIAARAVPEGRYALRNNEFVVSCSERKHGSARCRHCQ